ncbi:MAG: MBL fold metallo-hydrolase [Rhodospirillales bacterium 70-18]|nr:MBL fold metallo-hydrolase [Rhodospirillales bacterium]OJY64754.1 MAG: MBL fold metallo-hydrolase [Rhodospirillales bacterium 70-18]
MALLTEPLPERGAKLEVLAGIARVVAANPGPMTYHGTNTWLIEAADGFTVLDPGPDDPAHLAAVLAATGGRVARILLSHTHIDHLAGLPALVAATGAPTWGFHTPQDPAFVPDHTLSDNDRVGEWTALHTPGHASDHLCFARDDGVVFSADHVMGWSSTVVSPPHGDMVAYFASLDRMLAREDRIYLPGHGPAITDPRGHVAFLRDHRLQREAAILAQLAAGPQTTLALVRALYSQVNPALHRAAERNVTAHLDKLRAEGRAAPEGEVWRLAGG